MVEFILSAGIEWADEDATQLNGWVTIVDSEKGRSNTGIISAGRAEEKPGNILDGMEEVFWLIGS